MIGIKLADGSFYPVLEEGVPKTKKLTLTTARDNQEIVHVVLVRGRPGAKGGELVFIRELFLSGLEPAPGGAPDIELVLSVNKDLVLHARLNPPRFPAGDSGQPGWNYEAPRGPKGRGKARRGREEDCGVTLKYWESDKPVFMSGEEFAATGVYIRPNAVSLTAFILLCLFICAVLAFVFYQAFKAPPQPPLARALFLFLCSRTCSQPYFFSYFFYRKQNIPGKIRNHTGANEIR
jgi:hypothetical protein